MNAIEISNVSYAYTQDTSAVEDVSFSIAEKETTILIGPNGSGKTTLLKMMVGLLKPTNGEIHLFGKPPHAMRKQVGYVPQKLYFDQSFPITVLEFLKVSGRSSEEEVLEILKSVGAEHLSGSSLGKLSGGQLQRVLIARSLLGKPRILFFDEPVSGIDIGGERNFYELIKDIKEQYGVTIVMVSHEIHIVSQIADKVICINRKMLCSGEPHVALGPEMLDELYGKGLSVYNHEC